jgi:DNA-binding transcriptional LysR family regulator
MPVTLHQLNTLKAVKNHGSITAAAQALHITQPAVSNILKQLESHYPCPLIEIVGKKLYLTEAGLCLIDACDKISAALEVADTEINALNGKLSGTLRVTIVSTAKYFVPRILGSFRKTHPGIKVKLTVCNREKAIQTLRENHCDFLIMSQPPTELPIKQKFFHNDQLVVVGSPEMKFKRKMTLSDLAEHDWLIREPGSGTRIVMKKLFRQCKATPNVVMEVSNNESIKQLIMANMGISIVSKQSIELELEHNLLKVLPVVNFPLQHPWFVVMNQAKHQNSIINEFFDFVDQQSMG